MARFSGWGAGQVYTDEEQAARQAELRALLGQAGADPTTLDPGLAPAQKMPTADMFTPDWGIERAPYQPMTPEEALAQFGQNGQFAPPVASSMPAQFYERGGGQSGYGGGTTLGGAVGMGGGGMGMGQAASGGVGALRGMFGLGGGVGQSPASGGWFGGRQSPTPYVENRPSPTPYGMGRPSPTPYQGSGYSTLGSLSGYGRQRY